MIGKLKLPLAFIKNSIAILCVFFLLLISCQKDKNDPFLISGSAIGPLTNDIKVHQLDSLFREDSVVMAKGTGMFNNGNEIFIYDKKGTKLLRLDPVQDFDSTSTIGNIQIFDPRFKTKEGFGAESTFKDIVANYHISRIENTLNAIVVFIDELNAYVTIDKRELPPELFENPDKKIDASEIPPTAEITYFWIGWQ